MTAYWTEKHGSQEEQIHARIQEADGDHLGRRHLPRLFDKFDVESHHDIHHVLVTEARGPNPYHIRNLLPSNERLLPPSLVKQWARELLYALDFLHAAGIIHSGEGMSDIFF